ncbi:DNA-directed RNA polymerase subunit H [Candidatus Woesearchaeota archaeon]|nr:DNA-directed RNA polymerase subunit H [Candidatus Woesearchaeota archaeon]
MDASFDVTKHTLVPKHSKLTVEQVTKLIGEYNISIEQLPRILKSDPAIKTLDPEVGDVIEIERKSPTIGKAKYYRMVMNG